MQPPQVLAENDRAKRRAIADALEILRSHADFEDGDTADVRLGELRLPSGEIVHLIYVGFDSTFHQKTFLVSLPTASSVLARFEGKARFEELEISRLDGAIIDGRAHVRLSDGAQIQSVEVIPALLPYNITPLDMTIIRQTVAELGIEEECRYDPGELVRQALGTYPFHDSIDCSKLSGHPTPLLKSIQARIQDNDPKFGTVYRRRN